MLQNEPVLKRIDHQYDPWHMISKSKNTHYWKLVQIFHFREYYEGYMESLQARVVQ